MLLLYVIKYIYFIINYYYYMLLLYNTEKGFLIY